MTPDELAALGFVDAKRLPSGEWAALKRFFFTTALLVGIDGNEHRTRFCYPSLDDARVALHSWDGTGNPRGPWIKEKSAHLQRNNSATFQVIPIESVHHHR